MENILISACLLGINCRYDGKNKNEIDIEKLKERYNLIPVCPEVYGGLETPRQPSEILGDRVVSKDGLDLTDNFIRGAEEAYKLIRIFDIEKAILKERSPSCGSGKVYDGSFMGQLADGDGITAKYLKERNIEVIGESEIDRLLK